MPRGTGPRSGSRGLASLVLLGAWRAARAFVQIPARLAPGLASSLASSLGAGAGLPALGGALVVAGAAALGYQLLHAGEGAARQVLLSRQAAGGKPARLAVEVGGPHGEDVAGLAAAEGLPRPGVSAPLAGVSGPARPASGASASAAGARDGRYLQALALSTMVRIDDRPDASAGWPVASYCRAGVHALQCHHDDVWIRNRSSVDLRDVSICVAPAARAYFEIAGAGSDGCLHAELGARADRQIDVVEAPTPRAHYPGFHDLELDLSQDAWHAGVVLHRLWLPVMRPQTFFPLRKPDENDAQDERHAIGVQARRVDLLAELVVYTYHGSGTSVAELQSVGLDDPRKGFRIIARAEDPKPFRKYRVPECTARAQPLAGQLRQLGSGMSCAVLVSASDIHRAPYVGGSPIAHRDTHGIGQGEVHPLAEYAQLLGPIHGEAIRAMLRTRFRLPARYARSDLEQPRVPLVTRPVILAGGDFTAAGDIGLFQQPVPHLVMITTHGYRPPQGLMLMQQNRINAISASPDGRRMFIGGLFTPMIPLSVHPAFSALAEDDGTSWSFWNLRNGPDAQVLALKSADGLLYIGGAFQRVANLDAPGIVAMRVPSLGHSVMRWHSWRLLRYGMRVHQPQGPAQAGVVRALLARPGHVIVAGGSFGLYPGGGDPRDLHIASEPAAANIALWHESSSHWSSAGVLLGDAGVGPFGSWVNALAVYRGNLFAGGRFEWGAQGRNWVPRLLRLEGWAELEPGSPSVWVPVAPDVQANVTSMLGTGAGLYAGGRFRDRQTGARRLLLRWNGQHMLGLAQPLAIPADPGFEVIALANLGTMVFIGGRFSRLSDHEVVANLARFNELDDQATGIGRFGVNATVHVLQRILRMHAEVHE